MSELSASVAKASEDLTEACFKCRDQIRDFRNMAKTFAGSPKDTTLAMLQYLLIMAAQCGFDENDLLVTLGVAVKRAYSVGVPHLYDSASKICPNGGMVN
jgi:hypothetical protein